MYITKNKKADIITIHVLSEKINCRFKDCTKKGTHIAAYADGRMNVYCKEHASIVAKDGEPEYEADCPNCGCKFGVGF